MQIVDANVLLYAVNADAAHHRTAKAWLDAALAGGSAVGFSWVVLLAFLRLATSPRVFAQPLTIDVACDVVDGWLGQAAAVVVEPTARHLRVLGGLLAETGSAANLVNDAHLAALAAELDAEIISYDHDFGRFPGVRWRTPADSFGR
ncbi:MAG TPA: TA system VapC family ribonuclease toxin [Egibacteraceae bacterium]|nr:TA system VapC family ribonuclease toxin [Egibacteraceae bacterium]